jgi:predicted heme/steroid binding protein
MKTAAHKNRRSMARLLRAGTAALALMASALFMGCGGHQKEFHYAESVFVHNGDVFVAGDENVRTEGEVPTQAVLWKNGKKIFQYDTKGSSNESSYACSVFVTDTDTFVAGQAYRIDAHGSRAVLWKNGEAQHLTDGSQEACAWRVNVSGADVYVAGYEGNRAVLWKNGEAQHLTDGSQKAHAWSLFVSGADVYVAGHDGSAPALWKNGASQPLPEGIGSPQVFVSGDDVYLLSGTEVWKNGAKQSLAAAPNPLASSFFVSEGNIYVCGCSSSFPNYVPIIWKNGTLQQLSAADGTANSVFVSNGDVYVAGTMSNAIPVVWKNGAMQKLAVK